MRAFPVKHGSSFSHGPNIIRVQPGDGSQGLWSLGRRAPSLPVPAQNHASPGGTGSSHRPDVPGPATPDPGKVLVDELALVHRPSRRAQAKEGAVAAGRPGCASWPQARRFLLSAPRIARAHSPHRSHVTRRLEILGPGRSVPVKNLAG